MERPQRTREHYIEAVGRNHVERFILLRGHTFYEPRPDYGYDLVIATYDYKGDNNFKSGEVENESVYVQLKSTDSLTVLTDGVTIAFPIKHSHVVYWIDEPMPVILIVYSVRDAAAYWLHMQPYLKSAAFTKPAPTQKEVTVHLPITNVVNEDAIEIFRGYKSDALKRIAGLNLYG